MSALETLATNMASAITLANRTLPHADRIDRRRLMDARDRLQRYHDALVAELKRPVGGPYGTNGCWGENGRSPTVRDIIRTVEHIAQQTTGLVPGAPERPLSSGGCADAGADHAPAPASRDGSGTARALNEAPAQRVAANVSSSRKAA